MGNVEELLLATAEQQQDIAGQGHKEAPCPVIVSLLMYGQEEYAKVLVGGGAYQGACEGCLRHYLIDRGQEEDESRYGGESTLGEANKGLQRPERDDLDRRRRGRMEEESLKLRRDDEGPHIVPGDGGNGSRYCVLLKDPISSVSRA